MITLEDEVDDSVLTKCSLPLVDLAFLNDNLWTQTGMYFNLILIFSQICHYSFIKFPLSKFILKQNLQTEFCTILL